MGFFFLPDAMYMSEAHAEASPHASHGTGALQGKEAASVTGTLIICLPILGSG
jgi:hypothetical protein